MQTSLYACWVTAFNRTRQELKFVRKESNSIVELAFNRTRQELKYAYRQQQHYSRVSFNRTRQELKFKSY